MAKRSHRRAQGARSKGPPDKLAVTIAGLVTLLGDVATDPRKLKPGQLLQLLNSTPLGPVLDDRRLRAQRTEAGLRIGDGKTIDLVRYAAWLLGRWRRQPASSPARTPPPASPSEDSYLRKRDREAARARWQAAGARELGELPGVVDAARRDAASRSFRLFAETYFPEAFHRGWSDDHLRAIERIETAVTTGGNFALAMPRGSGKTTLCETAVLWSVLCEHHPYVMLVGATDGHAEQMLARILSELEWNDLLAEDWPAVCYPIKAIEGITQRCNGQTHLGQRTLIRVDQDRLVLPTIPGAGTSGAVVAACGLLASMRGAIHTRADGARIRPSLVVVDDPQTRQSARSLIQCEAREQTLKGDILGLGGPGAPIAVLMPCTVIRPGDVAHRMLDRQRNPAWHGETCKLVYAWPKRADLIERYLEIRGDALRHDRGEEEADAFWRANLPAIEEGGKVGWAERKLAGEISALQHAVKLRADLGSAFAAEYQNDPEVAGNTEPELIADELIEKINGYDRGVAPEWASHVTGMIDVQKDLLYWAIVAWSDKFSGAVLDYGAFPDQRRAYFTLREARPRLRDLYAGETPTGAIVKGLEELVGILCSHTWKREDGVTLSLDKLLVDSAWSTEAVQAFVRRAGRVQLLASQGRGITAAQKPMTEYRAAPGEQLGLHWTIAKAKRRNCRVIAYDTNWWKSFLRERLASSLGDAGCLSFYGGRGKADHRLLADHLTSEFSTATFGRGRRVDAWRQRPERIDNHWWDCLVGAAVAASLTGAQLPELGEARATPRTVRLSELRAEKRRTKTATRIGRRKTED